MNHVLPLAADGVGLVEDVGDPLLLRWMAEMVLGPIGENQDIQLNAMLFAGWVGMFVTALNLLPISQLDGGHVVYGVFGWKSRYVSMAAFGAMALIVVAVSSSYLLFLVLLWWIGIKHPPTLNDSVQLGRSRKIIAAVLLVVFILCFTPSPLQV